MADTSGGEVVDRLGGKDLNKGGRIVNLAIVGSSRFYDYGLVEEAIEEWIGVEANPDLVIVGGASGVDYLAERWCDNNNVDIAVFSEEWDDPGRSLQDKGRKEAPNTLTAKILNGASHILAMPSSTSKWTRIVIEQAGERGIPTDIHEVD